MIEQIEQLFNIEVVNEPSTNINGRSLIDEEVKGQRREQEDLELTRTWLDNMMGDQEDKSLKTKNNNVQNTR